MKIIIVDDDYLVVNSLKTIVNSNEIEVLAVGYDEFDAISLFEKHRPHIVLMDIRMEGLNGTQLAIHFYKIKFGLNENDLNG